jgi:hypothetical protein
MDAGVRPESGVCEAGKATSHSHPMFKPAGLSPGVRFFASWRVFGLVAVLLAPTALPLKSLVNGHTVVGCGVCRPGCPRSARSR